jgi:hypothetical protein
MVIDMNDKQLLTLAQLQSFLNGTVAVNFSVAAEERYDFIARTVCRFGYATGENICLSSRGRRNPRGVEHKMSNFPLRPFAAEPLPPVNITKAIHIIK